MPFETSFARALLDPAQPTPDGIAAADAAVATRRFGVHRNNVMAGLIEVLESRFPAVAKIVGEEFFTAMAQAFVLEKPPRTPLLGTYGEEFAGFVATFEPARELAYLADVARLEMARTRAYHAADAVPLDASCFAALDAEAIAGSRIALHPSAEIIRSPHPVVTIWAMNAGGQEVAPIVDWCGEDVLVVRPGLDVEVRKLAPGGAEFLLVLVAGRPLGEAAAAALSACPQFDLTGNLVTLIGSGLVGGIASA